MQAQGALIGPNAILQLIPLLDAREGRALRDRGCSARTSGLARGLACARGCVAGGGGVGGGRLYSGAPHSAPCAAGAAAVACGAVGPAAGARDCPACLDFCGVAAARRLRPPRLPLARRRLCAAVSAAGLAGCGGDRNALCGQGRCDLPFCHCAGAEGGNPRQRASCLTQSCHV